MPDYAEQGALHFRRDRYQADAAQIRGGAQAMCESSYVAALLQLNYQSVRCGITRRGHEQATGKFGCGNGGPSGETDGFIGRHISRLVGRQVRRPSFRFSSDHHRII